MTIRNISTRLLPFVLLFSLLLTACAPVATLPAADSPSPSPTAQPSPAPEVPADPIAEQVAAMTTEEKVGQLLIGGFEGTTAGEDVRTAIEDYQVGGIIFYQRNVGTAEELVSLTNALKALNAGQVPLFLCTDQEGGLVSRMPEEIASLPSAYTFGQISDEQARDEACFQLGQTLGSLCAAFGFNMDFAPVLDVWSNPDNTIIGKRAFSTDAVSAALCGVQAAAGLRSAGVVPVGKHFPGHGDTAVDSHVGLPVVTKTLDELKQTELLPFRSAIEAQTPISSIMVGHILMTELDPDRPASLSPAVVTGLLREELGFEGVICTDDLTMAAISDTYGMGEAAVLALEAGCDLLLVCHGSEPLAQARQGLLDAVASGRITQERLEESVYRLLTLKAEYALNNDPIPAADSAALNSRIDALLSALPG